MFNIPILLFLWASSADDHVFRDVSFFQQNVCSFSERLDKLTFVDSTQAPYPKGIYVNLRQWHP